ncbi:amidase family protein [Paraburkholderia xenovorans LB400]|uniref:Amidase n=1 Tax=Paraburkholderia xenovorans (strain LB400) TaxID=266265 RepID=Q13FM8_PARXL|nr:amidase [Paraburkholderia xenovorans]ABE37111.1 Amidase [Paraburkholderia xenovorans LB400]AIP34905.1 amidase family protein [Paraburkholderia xenovorans LB400]
MSADDLHYLPLTVLAERIRTKTVSSLEVTQTQLDRIARLNPGLRAYVTVTADVALEQARAADEALARGDYKGPLHGIPIGVKDLAWTRGIPTQFGSVVYRDHIPTEDATVVRKLREAGAVLLGKLQLTEGAYSEHHPEIPAPVNPWRKDLWPGVSSSGSGVATAAGLAYGTLGTDTGGSIRFPAGANGVTGLKPTWGRVSRYGAFELAATLDHIGPIARTVDDVAAILGVIAGVDDLDPTAADRPVPDYLTGIDKGIRGVRIGIDKAWNEQGTDPQAATAVSDAIEVLRRAGAAVVDVKFPDAVQNNLDWIPLAGVQTAVAHEEIFASRKAEYGPVLANLIRTGQALSGTDYQKIILRREDFRGRVDRLFRDIDLLIVPSYGVAAPTYATLSRFIEEPTLAERLTRYTFPFDATGQPTLSLNGGFTDDGAPVGFQLVAAAWNEPLLLRAGHTFQQETDWHLRHPSL